MRNVEPKAETKTRNKPTLNATSAEGQTQWSCPTKADGKCLASQTHTHTNLLRSECSSSLNCRQGASSTHSDTAGSQENIIARASSLTNIFSRLYNVVLLVVDTRESAPATPALSTILARPQRSINGQLRELKAKMRCQTNSSRAPGRRALLPVRRRRAGPFKLRGAGCPTAGFQEPDCQRRKTCLADEEMGLQ